MCFLLCRRSGYCRVLVDVLPMFCVATVLACDFFCNRVLRLFLVHPCLVSPTLLLLLAAHSRALQSELTQRRPQATTAPATTPEAAAGKPLASTQSAQPAEHTLQMILLLVAFLLGLLFGKYVLA